MSVFSAPLGRIESVTQLFGYALGPDRAHRVQKHKRTQGPRDHGRSRPRNQRWIDFLRSTRTYLETIRGWRARISREPTISNELAAEEGSNGGQD